MTSAQEKRDTLVRNCLLNIQNCLNSSSRKLLELVQRASLDEASVTEKLPEITLETLEEYHQKHFDQLTSHSVYSTVEAANIISNAQKKVLDQQGDINFHFDGNLEDKLEEVKSPIRRQQSPDFREEHDQRLSIRKKFPRFKPLLKTKKRKQRKDLYGFEYYAWQLKVSSRPLSDYLVSARKVITTKDWEHAREESKQVKLYQKIDHLKRDKLWSFKQLSPFTDPERPKSHRDFLLDEMRWMQSDFKQEKKWKIALAYHLAHECKLQYDALEKKSSLKKAVDHMEIDNQNELNKNSNLKSAQKNQVLSLTNSITHFDLDASTISDCPVYEAFNEDDQISRKTIPRIIPVSKYMLMNVELKSREKSEFEVKQVSDRPPETFLFSGVDDALLKISSARKPETGVTDADWTVQEINELKLAWEQYGSNWNLISDMICNLKSSADYRTPWSCYVQFCRLNSLEPVETGEIVVKEDLKGLNGTSWHLITEARSRMMKKMFSTIDVIRKCGRKRDSLKTTPQPVPKKINLTAHETHLQSQMQAGVNTNGPVLNSMELSQMKERRDKELRQVHNHQVNGFPLNRNILNRPGTLPFQQQFRPVNRPQTPTNSGLSNQQSGNTTAQASGESSQRQSGVTNTPAASNAGSSAPAARTPFGPIPTPLTQDQMKAALARNMMVRGLPFPANQFSLQMDPSAFQMTPAAAQRLQQQIAQQQAALAAANANGSTSNPSSSKQNSK